MVRPVAAVLGVKRGDVIWVPYRRDPLWPALVQNAYPKKLTYVFFPLPSDTERKANTFSCHPKVVCALSTSDVLPPDSTPELDKAYRAACRYLLDRDLKVGSYAMRREEYDLLQEEMRRKRRLSRRTLDAEEAQASCSSATGSPAPDTPPVLTPEEPFQPQPPHTHPANKARTQKHKKPEKKKKDVVREDEMLAEEEVNEDTMVIVNGSRDFIHHNDFINGDIVMDVDVEENVDANGRKRKHSVTARSPSPATFQAPVLSAVSPIKCRSTPKRAAATSSPAKASRAPSTPASARSTKSQSQIRVMNVAPNTPLPRREKEAAEEKTDNARPIQSVSPTVGVSDAPCAVKKEKKVSQSAPDSQPSSSSSSSTSPTEVAEKLSVAEVAARDAASIVARLWNKPTRRAKAYAIPPRHGLMIVIKTGGLITDAECDSLMDDLVALCRREKRDWSTLLCTHFAAEVLLHAVLVHAIVKTRGGSKTDASAMLALESERSVKDEKDRDTDKDGKSKQTDIPAINGSVVKTTSGLDELVRVACEIAKEEAKEESAKEEKPGGSQQ